MSRSKKLAVEEDLALHRKAQDKKQSEKDREINRRAVKKYSEKFHKINCRFERTEYPEVEKAAKIEGKSVGRFVTDTALQHARDVNSRKSRGSAV